MLFRVGVGGGGRINPPGPRRPKKPGLNRVNIHVNIHIKPNSKMRTNPGTIQPCIERQGPECSTISKLCNE